MSTAAKLSLPLLFAVIGVSFMPLTGVIHCVFALCLLCYCRFWLQA